MGRKVRIEIDKDAEEEVVIRCREITDEILELQRMAERGSAPKREILMTLGENEVFVPVDGILFFETEGGHTVAYTADKMYRTGLRLYELPDMLPNWFMRVSKSCVLNTRAVSALKKNVTGVCEAYLAGGNKKVFVSRMYYKPFREMLSERHKGEKNETVKK